MDLDKFKREACRLFRVLMDFPENECFWNEKYLKMHFWVDIEWEVRVFFNFAFNAPVFYFKPRTVYLSLEEILPRIQKFQDFISQAEFPETGEPFYFLHPCQSADLLKVLDLAGWLSVVLQVIGVYLPIGLYEIMKKEEI